MRVLYVATVVKTHIMEFHLPYLKMLKDMGWETAVAARNDYSESEKCDIPFCDVYYDIPFERNPLKPGNIKAYKMLKRVIEDGQFDIIHCHTPVGAMLTRIAARKVRKKGARVFYTAHGFHFYSGAPLLNWLIYYPVERILARKTDVLITINCEDFKRAQKFKAGKTVYAPGIGIDTKRFSQHACDSDKIRKELGIPKNGKMLLSVGEVNKNKNHRVVIEALPSLDNCWYVICGQGPLMEQHVERAKQLGVQNRVLFVGYRTDVEDFYQAADIFVFPSFREGLPVALMEAMASEIPCVSARNRGTNDLMENSPFLFVANDKKDLIEKVNRALKEDVSEEVLRNTSRLKKFDISNVKEIVKNEYLASIR